ncbi:MAG: hypothetical protein H0U74_17740 [Bradymonadaceae bacterium]|nr:hypothetical protein [Lujinxingiaceae bacterium]
MFTLLRFSLAFFLVLSLAACGDDKATERTPSDTAHFQLKVSGPSLEGERTVIVPVDQISGIAYASSLQLLFVRKEDSDSEVYTMTLSLEGPTVGEHVFVAKKADMSLGGFDDKNGMSLSMKSESGTLTLTTYDTDGGWAAGTIDAVLRRTNASSTDELYTVKGSFKLKP